ncbi:MAG: protocatechuate 3,4-dioxygenase subunit alpha [Granulosicoccus sp.]
MAQSIVNIVETPSQTAGPYVQIGCTPNFAGINGVYAEDIGLRAIEDGAQGEIITIKGRVYDKYDEPMFDPMIESWQADAAGRFAGQPEADPHVNGFCRFPLDTQTAEYTLRTVKPGRTPCRAGGYHAPHIALWIVARGNNIGLNTRLYFEDEAGYNEEDLVLLRVKPLKRLETLLAKRVAEHEYRFDIRLRGEQETVFFDM